MVKPIGLVIRPGHHKALLLAQEVQAWCKQKGYELLLEHDSAAILGEPDRGVSSGELCQKAEPIITLGGDGTLIGVARHVAGESPTFIGVNFGNLGFLTEVRPNELFKVLEHTLAGQSTCAERLLLEVKLIRNGQVVFSSQAVNDVVVQKAARSRLPEFDLTTRGRDIARIRADGMIFATPTGSTAYSLAAGGSIAHPSVNVILVTPICPHSLTNRPLILPGSSILEVQLPHFDNEVLVTIDGQVSEEFLSGDSVVISQAKQTVRFVISEEQDYFDILRTKLNWGVPNRPD
jgi:NAD+ kinase